MVSQVYALKTGIWHHFYLAFFLSYKLMRNMQEFETPRWLTKTGQKSAVGWARLT